MLCVWGGCVNVWRGRVRSRAGAWTLYPVVMLNGVSMSRAGAHNGRVIVHAVNGRGVLIACERSRVFNGTFPRAYRVGASTGVLGAVSRAWTGKRVARGAQALTFRGVRVC